jgi:hypothetical protein
MKQKFENVEIHAATAQDGAAIIGETCPYCHRTEIYAASRSKPAAQGLWVIERDCGRCVQGTSDGFLSVIGVRKPATPLTIAEISLEDSHFRKIDPEREVLVQLMRKWSNRTGHIPHISDLYDIAEEAMKSGNEVASGD